MKAVRYHHYGAADVLVYEDADEPAPGPRQVLLRVAGTTFNPSDSAIRAGYLQQVFPLAFPHIPGVEVSGTVAELGDGVDEFSIDDAVLGMLPMNASGSAAEYALAPAAALTAAPTSIPLAEAAALPGNGTTAWQALVEYAELRPGQRVLITGGGGSVGGYAVQLAHQLGAQVIVTGSPRSAERLATYGADQVIDHTTTAVPGAVTEPVDAVLNTVAFPPAELAALMSLVRPGGVFVSTVFSAVPEAERGVRVLQETVRADAAQLAELVARVDRGELDVHVAQRRPLANAAAVHAEYDTGRFAGRVVLVPPRPDSH